MPETFYRHKIPTGLRSRRTLIVYAALAIFTIEVVDQSIFNFCSRRLLNNVNENKGIAVTNDPNSAVRNVALLIPADGPDPRPHKIVDDIRSKDPELIDPLCSATSQVRITNAKTMGKNGVSGHMIFQSIALDGTIKTVGGDEYYVKYTGSERTNGGSSPDAVAHITDLDNGMYELHFVQPFVPMHTGTIGTTGHRRSDSIVDLQAGKLEVNLDYTCGIGYLAPATKLTWINSGYINSHWEVAVKSSMVPSITMAEDRPLPQQFGSKFRNYDAIYGVGDSLMTQFVTTGGSVESSWSLRRSNFYIEKNKGPLDMKTLPAWMSFIDQMLQEHPELRNGNCAILLGSGIWDLVRATESIESHIEAMGKYIEQVHIKAPSAHIYWKSMTSVHISVVDEAYMSSVVVDVARKRLKYCSRSRAKAIYEAQSEVLQRMNIPLLDMYNMTFEAEEWHRGHSDALHYDDKLNGFFMDYFYSPDSSTTSLSHQVPFLR